MTTIVAIPGSIRRASLNRRLLRAAAARLTAAGATVDEADVEAMDLPIYNGDLQDRDGVPAAAVDLQARIAAADGVLIASPEYNGAFSPLLKNTLDWITRVDMVTFQPTLIGLIGASPGRRGAVHGMGMVEEMFRYMRCTVHQPHFSVPTANEAMDDAGEITDPDLAERLTEWAAGYLRAAEAFEGPAG